MVMEYWAIGQDLFNFLRLEPKLSSQDLIASLIEWQPTATLSADVDPAMKKNAAWLLLPMFRTILLAVWHALFDPRLAEKLNNTTFFSWFWILASEHDLSVPSSCNTKTNCFHARSTKTCSKL